MSVTNEHLVLLMEGVPKSMRERIKAAYWLGALDCMKDCGLRSAKQPGNGQSGKVISIAPQNGPPSPGKR